MNLNRNLLQRLHTIGEVVAWLGWFLAGASVVGAISYYYTPLLPRRGLAGVIYLASIGAPFVVSGIALVVIGRAFQDGRSWGRTGLVVATLLLEVPLLYGWYRVLSDAAEISSTTLIMRGVFSLVVVAPLSFLIYVAVQWLRSPAVTAIFEQGHLANFTPGDE